MNKKYNKLKNALLIVTDQKKETEKELDYIESIVFSIENSKTLSDINEIYVEISNNLSTKKEVMKKEKNKQKPKNPKKQDEVSYDVLNIDGFQVYVGKNNIQNDYITTKLAEKSDWWFHVKNMPGSHVLMQCGKEEPSEVDFTEAAEIAAYYSSAKDGTIVTVDYTDVKNIKKPNGTKPGFVSMSSYRTIYIDPDQKEIEAYL